MSSLFFSLREIEREQRHIPNNVRVEVWNKADGHCEVCGRDARFIGHEFHHEKKGPATANTVILLCTHCHRYHAHIKRSHIEHLTGRHYTTVHIRTLEQMKKENPEELKEEVHRTNVITSYNYMGDPRYRIEKSYGPSFLKQKRKVRRKKVEDPLTKGLYFI